MKKGGKFYGIWNYKCPRCQDGDLFPKNKGFFQMHKTCPTCNQAYYLEPGFYWGAMYVAYAFTSIFMLVNFAIFFFLFDFTITGTFALIIPVMFLLYPFWFKISRSIWLSAFVRFEPNAAQIAKEKKKAERL